MKVITKRTFETTDGETFGFASHALRHQARINIADAISRIDKGHKIDHKSIELFHSLDYDIRNSYAKMLTDAAECASLEARDKSTARAVDKYDHVTDKPEFFAADMKYEQPQEAEEPSKVALPDLDEPIPSGIGLVVALKQFWTIGDASVPVHSDFDATWMHRSDEFPQLVHEPGGGKYGVTAVEIDPKIPKDVAYDGNLGHFVSIYNVCESLPKNFQDRWYLHRALFPPAPVESYELPDHRTEVPAGWSFDGKRLIYTTTGEAIPHAVSDGWVAKSFLFPSAC